MLARTLSVLLLVTAAFAGCVGDDPSAGDNPAPEEQTDEQNATIDPPQWALGDYWTWSSDEQGEVSYVVTGEEESDWIVDTTNEGVAFFHARFPVSTLGEIRKEDLAGSQPATRVQFFDWPLEEGKAWTTTWDGVEREITVEAVEDGVAHLTARQKDRVAVEYTYDREAGSFGEMVFLDENGTQTFGLDLVSSGSEFEGTAVRWQLQEIVDEDGSLAAPPSYWTFGFEVDEGVEDIWGDVSVQCPSGGFELAIDGEDDEYRLAETCPASIEQSGPLIEDPSPGTYEGFFSGTSPLDEGTYDILVLVRTLKQVSVGEG